MRVFKERQFIIFEFDDHKTVKYNLANGETIGKNNRIVKSLNTQLRGYSIQDIINSIEDENYRNFISYVNKEINRSTAHCYDSWNWGTRFKSNQIVNKITNVGSLLSKINDYSLCEQYFACGLTNVDLDTRSNTRINVPINEIPKGLIKLCRQHNIKLNSNVLKAYTNIPNLFTTLLSMEFNTITQDNIVRLLCVLGICIDAEENDTWTVRHNRHYPNSLNNIDDYLKIKFLVVNYIYNIKSLLTYLDNLMTYEAIENFLDLIREFYDYVKMASKISAKYEKYPRYFLSTHRITCRNYDRLEQEFSELNFAKHIDTNLEYKIGDYKFIYPKQTQDIKDEAVQQSNCVASYIQKVIDGQCHIMFLRKQNKDTPKKEEQYNHSLITLEIRDYKVVQARGKFNRLVTEQEQELINQFNKYLLKLKNKKLQKEVA